MLVMVNKIDIAVAEKLSVTNCPIAVALRRRKPMGNILVGPGVVEVDGEEYILSKGVANIQRVYDKTGNMSPFNFDI